MAPVRNTDTTTTPSLRAFDVRRAYCDDDGVPLRRVTIVLTGDDERATAAAAFVRQCARLYGRTTFVSQSNALALDRVLSTSTNAVIVSNVSRATLLSAWRDETRASVFVMASSIHHVPSVVRRAANYVVVAGHVGEQRELHSIHRATCSLRVTQAEFMRIYTATVEPHRHLVICCDDLDDETNVVERTFAYSDMRSLEHNDDKSTETGSWSAWLRSFWW